MNVKSLITASRSYRSFDRAYTISREQLSDFVDCARLSPSSRNLQVLKFRLVSTEDECEKVFPLTRWAGLIRDRKIPPENHEPTAYIVICIDQALTADLAPFQRDVGIAAQSILLCATEAGFGGCMIGSFSAADLKSALSLPQSILPQLVIALGKPDDKIALTDAANGVAYYREGDLHVVPKRSLEEIII